MFFVSHQTKNLKTSSVFSIPTCLLIHIAENSNNIRLFGDPLFLFNHDKIKYGIELLMNS